MLAMDSSDVVGPGDAALYELLGRIAGATQEEQKRERILDLMLTVPSIAEWPPEAIEEWRSLATYLRGLRCELERRELERLFNAGGGDETELV